ncbi:hypothetical protein HPB50_013095 [Hyalomma asiaticum]|uniref:Uncharacterized protein n=1 Tax=Hyalomma asiaticum TaxID=266040 RepID=A0ACB7SMY6_HYAAI|nr:hypothetical protein HPB50_013095 [Hyalomma asiaticum]
MEPDQNGGQMDVGLNAEMTRVTEESAGGSGSNQMAMLQMQLRIAEMELAMERLRNENGARAAAAVQSTEADRSEDRRNHSSGRGSTMSRRHSIAMTCRVNGGLGWCCPD